MEANLRANRPERKARAWHSGGHRFDPGQVHHLPILRVTPGSQRAGASSLKRRTGTAAIAAHRSSSELHRLRLGRASTRCGEPDKAGPDQ